MTRLDPAMTEELPPPAPAADTRSDNPAKGEAVVVLRQEQLHATTTRVPTGVAVLKKTVVSELRTVTVEVRREEVELVVRPWVDDGQDLPAGAHVALPELVLYEEEIVVTRRLVPRERVRLLTVSVTELREISATVRHEVVDLQTGPGADVAGSERPA